MNKKTLTIVIGVVVLVVLFLIFSVEGQTTSVNLEWTAPHEDGLVGGAVSAYSFKYSTDSLDLINNWDNCIDGIVTSLTPSLPGEIDYYTLGFLPSNTTLYIGIKSMDEVQNCSGLSNIITVVTPDGDAPESIIDLIESQ